MKNVLVINGHPDKESFNYALSEAYLKGLKESNSNISQINIAELDFDPNLKFGYRKRMELEPDLVSAIEKIKSANHIVWVFPMWWYSYPAIMKGFIDRTFLPGITYQPIEGKAFPAQLLKGKTARLIITADTPKWYDSIFMKSPAVNQFKNGTLKFCGVKRIKVSYFAPIKSSSQKIRAKWLAKVEGLGKKGK
ncbi:NAD(P)H-dependent oxidoreductase [Brumimicrobium aurantiacum]|uniref:Flavodoxin family protein n=1 Tax=Brumimicrobium aurantiacum TaxID=1737063 RepID=A0A3E1F151_9FLAO|nr:NAD(P)H-dependent oxidoreductase [Brumimicrobium aurantiacum]RFC55544.1 flavodoxin family protein [Brumimicrobium aurantiacum]